MGDAYAAALYFVNQKMMPGSRWVNVPSFIHAKSWSLTSIGVSSFSAADALGTLKQMEYFLLHRSNIWSQLPWSEYKRISRAQGMALPGISQQTGRAGRLFQLELLWAHRCHDSYIRRTKTRCNSLIFLSRLPISTFKHADSVGTKTWLRDTCKILLPHTVFGLV